jgi:hypothetical protein
MAQSSLDRALKNRGFGGLDDPAINQQLAFCVRDHEHFRQVLCSISPDKRTLGYEAMRPYLRFEAKPLDVYMAEAADIAARREAEQTSIDVLASKAIQRNMADEAKQGGLVLKCSMCTREYAYPGRNRKEAEDTARTDGWRISRLVDSTGSVLRVFCPACAKIRSELNRA